MPGSSSSLISDPVLITLVPQLQHLQLQISPGSTISICQAVSQSLTDPVPAVVVGSIHNILHGVIATASEGVVDLHEEIGVRDIETTGDTGQRLDNIH